MQSIDLTKLTNGQIAMFTVAGTLVATFVAGFFALVVAGVNAWAANWHARVRKR